MSTSIILCRSIGEDVRKVNVNKEEGYAQTVGASAHLVPPTDVVISSATGDIIMLCILPDPHCVGRMSMVEEQSSLLQDNRHIRRYK